MSVDQKLKLQIGEMIVQLAMAANRIEELEVKIKELEEVATVAPLNKGNSQGEVRRAADA
jgi:hypothetical protein